MSSSEHCRPAIFQIYNVQNLKIIRITTFHIFNVVYQAGSRWDPKWVFNFLLFFERILYKSNYIIFILSWCGTHTKIRSKLVDIVTAGSQKITLWGPQRTPFGILRVKHRDNWPVPLHYPILIQMSGDIYPLSGGIYPMNWVPLKPCTCILRVFGSNVVSQPFQVNDNIIPLTVYDCLPSIFPTHWYRSSARHILFYSQFYPLRTTSLNNNQRNKLPSVITFKVTGWQK